MLTQRLPGKQSTSYCAALLLFALFLALPAYPQGANVSGVALRPGIGISGVNVAVCAPLATTAASVTSNLAALTTASNPITAGFVAGMTIQVAGFTGGDIYYNGGTIVNGQITNGFTILSVTSTQIVYALVHANASATSNGTVLQEGNATTSCAALSSVYTDSTLGTLAANPTATDGLGNFNAWVTPGQYQLQYYSASVPAKLFPSSGACVPLNSTSCGISLGGDNTLTSNNRFKGPIPWRDITAYMPAGGCSSTTPVNGADTTGTINSGSTSLSLASARDFKNGCGIAVLGAGPTSTLSTPPVSLSPTSASRSGGSTVTMVFSGTPLNPASFGSVGTGEAVSVTGCNVAAYNGFQNVLTETVGGGNTTITYNSGASATDTATSCTAAFIFGNTHGVTGSTTYTYKLVKCDFNEGCSAASSAFTVTSGNATLSKNNYNWIGYPFDTTAAIWLLYSDKGLGGALTCVNASVSMAMIDIGGYNPCPPYAPTNPPGAATAQTLFTTISSGAGTTTLTLANAASNNATTQNVYHDESSFLNSCITDTNNEQPNTGPGGAAYGCYIPAGAYGMNGPIKTATQATNGSLNIYVAGLLNFQTQPWQILKSNYQIISVGGGSQGGTVGQKKAMTAIKFGPNVPYGFVFGTASFQTSIKGFQMQLMNGTGVFIGATNPSNGTSGVSVEDVSLTEQGSSGNAPCVTIDDDNIGIWLTNVSCQANQAVGGMPCVYITHTPSGSLVNQILRNNGVHCTFHGWKIDGPGGQAAGAAIHDILYQDSFSENLPNADIGQFQVDAQVNGFNSGGWSLQGVSLDHLISSDASAQSTFVQMAPTSANAMPISAVEVKNSYLSGTASTCATITACGNNVYPSTVLGISSSGVGLQNMPSGQTGIISNSSFGAAPNLVGGPLGLVPTNANFGANPAIDMPFIQYLAAPGGSSVNSTGAGSLAANVYCAQFTANDVNGNQTGATNAVCQTVGASSSIKYDFAGNTQSINAYSGYNFYYCAVASGTCTPNQKLASISTVSDGGAGLFYTFTSTAGATANSPPLQGTAMMSWLANDPTNPPLSCFFCVASSSDSWPIGFGMLPTANAGYNLYTKLGIKMGGPSQLANAGVFTNTQMNEYLQSIINSCSPLTEFQALQGGTNYSTDGETGCLSVPNTATVHQSNGLAGYENTSSTATNAVGVYGSGRCIANSTLCYGGNFVVKDMPALTGHTMIGAEIDTVVTGTPALAEALRIPAPSSGGTMPAASSAIHIVALGTPTPFPFGLSIDDGAINGAALIVPAIGPVANSNSTQLIFHTRDAGNVQRSAIISADHGLAANRNLNILDPGGNGNFSFATVEYCGATSGATQACAKTVQGLPIIVWGDVQLNTATTQSITTLPFTDALYSCSGSDLTSPAGVVSFSSYAAASVTIQETGGVNTDHLRYQCVGH